MIRIFTIALDDDTKHVTYAGNMILQDAARIIVDIALHNKDMDAGNKPVEKVKLEGGQNDTANKN